MEQISISVLDPETAHAFSGLTFPRFREHLRNLQEHPDVVAVGAALLGRPVGLAVARTAKGHVGATGSSIYVQPEYRRMGLGTALLGKLEELLRARGRDSLAVTYEAGKPSTLAVERMLEKRGWPQAQPHKPVFKLDLMRLKDAPWLRLLGRLPAGFSIFPWKDLSEEDLRSIRDRQDQDHWIPDFALFRHGDAFEPESSVGLRYDGQVVGWVINTVIDPSTFVVQPAWVQIELQRVGHSFLLASLIAHSLAIVLERTQYKYTLVIPAWPPMVTFSRRHLTPWCASVNETYHAVQPLHG